MPRLFLPNFDFEHRLAGAAGGGSMHGGSVHGGSAAVREASQRLAFAWLLVAEDNDRIVLPDAFEPGFLDLAAQSGLPRVVPVRCRDTTPRAVAAQAAKFASGCELVPWGWDAGAHALAASLGSSLGSSHDAPDVSAVRRVNSRRFSHELEVTWAVGLPGAAAVSSLDQLAEAVRAATRVIAPKNDGGRWVIKAEFGMSARERLLGKGPTLTEAAAGWARRRLARDGVVFFEPWVNRLDEAGVQVEIPRSGPPRLVGATRLLVDDAGGYDGSAFAADDALVNEFGDEFGDVVEVVLRAAAAVQQAGYFGPLGIDVMRYRGDDGTTRWRPLQDLNARWTMGRLALGGRRWLRGHERGEWRSAVVRRMHDPAAAYEAWQAAQCPTTRTFRTSPFTLCDQAAAAVSALRCGVELS